MNTLELLKKAIELQKPISFEYNKKEGKVAGKRIGNTHVIFVFTKNLENKIQKLIYFKQEVFQIQRLKSHYLVGDFLALNISLI